MSEHHASIRWHRGTAPFDYDTYSRNHVWSIGSTEIEASAAPEYFGSESRADPEQAFVASLASCHMLTFLAIAARRKLVVDGYTDSAIGYLEKNSSGALSITRVVLRPDVIFDAATIINDEQLHALHQKAHKFCFIANSVKTEIIVDIPALK